MTIRWKWGCQSQSWQTYKHIPCILWFVSKLKLLQTKKFWEKDCTKYSTKYSCSRTKTNKKRREALDPLVTSRTVGQCTSVTNREDHQHIQIERNAANPNQIQRQPANCKSVAWQVSHDTFLADFFWIMWRVSRDIFFSNVTHESYNVVVKINMLSVWKNSKWVLKRIVSEFDGRVRFTKSNGNDRP